MQGLAQMAPPGSKKQLIVWQEKADCQLLCELESY